VRAFHTWTHLLDIEEVELRSVAIVGIALAIGTSAPVAIAQTEQPTVHHYHHIYPHHAVHHHHYVAVPAPGPATVVTAPVVAPQAGPFGLALPHIAPYPDGKGDEDGLSDDEDNCNKGCVGGAPD
jgi:hypothetical protein